MIRRRTKGLAPLVILFVVLNAFFIAGKHMLQRWNIDQDVVIIGNLILFLVTVISFFVSLGGLRNNNSHAFVRGVYGSFMIKFFVLAAAAFVYISVNKTKLNKPALFICMGLFLVYLFLEVGILMKMLKEKKNG